MEKAQNSESKSRDPFVTPFDLSFILFRRNCS